MSLETSPKTKKECDREVEVCSGESIRGVVGDGIDDATTSNDDKELELREELQEDCAENTNGLNDNHKKVVVGDINENKKRT